MAREFAPLFLFLAKLLAVLAMVVAVIVAIGIPKFLVIVAGANLLVIALGLRLSWVNRHQPWPIARRRWAGDRHRAEFNR